MRYLGIIIACLLFLSLTIIFSGDGIIFAGEYKHNYCTDKNEVNNNYVRNNDKFDERQKITFTLLYTADEHSSLIPHSPAIDYNLEIEDPTVGGFARLATAISDVKKDVNNENLLKVSAGDFLSGNPFSWLGLRGHTPELDLLQEIGFDIVTLGNHEYDFGIDFLANHLRSAGYPDSSEKTSLLATNTYFPREHSLSKLGIKEYQVKELSENLKIGFIGLLGVDAQYFVRDIEPVEFLCEIESARETVQHLKDKGADVIISVNHAGVEVNKRLADKVEDIDIIVGGHTHKVLCEPVKVDDTIIVQPGSHLEYMGRLELSYDYSENQLEAVNDKKGVKHLVALDDSVDEEDEIRQMINEYILDLNKWISELTDGSISKISQIVTTTSEVIEREPEKSETPMGNLITDAMRFKAEKVTGKQIDFAFQVNGQIRNDLLPGSVEGVKNKVTFYDLAQTVGMGQTYKGNPGYPLVTMKITEKEVRRLLEGTLLASEFAGNRAFLQVSGLRYTYAPERVVMFNLPYRNIPVPTLRAVESVEVYTGTGAQMPKPHESAKDYIPLGEDNKETYKVVIDSYFLEFLNMAQDSLPFFYSINPQSLEGKPIDRQDQNEVVLKRDGTPVTLWESLVDYSMKVEDITYYAEPEGRINTTSAINPLILPTFILGFVGIVIVFIKLNNKK